RLDHEVDGAGAHGRDHVVDAAVRGLHDDGNVEPRLAHPGEHTEPVEIGHHEVEDDAADAGLAAGQDAERDVAALGDDRLIAGAADHVLDQAARNRVVVDDQDPFRHGLPSHYATVSQRGTLADQA